MHTPFSSAEIQTTKPRIMKPKTPPARRSEKATEPPADGQTPINITPEEGKTLRECAAKTGQPVEQFVRKIIVEGCAKLTDAALAAIPCPFCNRTDMLEIYPCSWERPDATEYQGDAVKCRRCEAFATVESWARRGMPVAMIGGAA
jgi:hypothetical protein